MPKLGEIIGPIKRSDPNSASLINLAGWGRKYQWQSCPDCCKERWVALGRNYTPSPRCKNCNWVNIGKASGSAKKGSWKGGRHIETSGYITGWVGPDDFFFSMATKRWRVMEHRIVMAKHLGRNLHPWELVHHKGIKYPIGSIENKQDNRIENLQIIVSGNTGSHNAKIKCPFCRKEFRIH